MLRSVILHRCQELTARKHRVEYFYPENFRLIEWYRPPDYLDEGNSYGSLQGTYVLNRKLVLLNLGDIATRSYLRLLTGLSVNDLDPDMQYSGYGPNVHVHRAILESNSFELRRFDGTITSTNYNTSEDLDGAEEVVLFKSRTRGALTLLSVQS